MHMQDNNILNLVNYRISWPANTPKNVARWNIGREEIEKLFIKFPKISGNFFAISR